MLFASLNLWMLPSCEKYDFAVSVAGLFTVFFLRHSGHASLFPGFSHKPFPQSLTPRTDVVTRQHVFEAFFPELDNECSEAPASSDASQHPGLQFNVFFAKPKVDKKDFALGGLNHV